MMTDEIMKLIVEYLKEQESFLRIQKKDFFNKKIPGGDLRGLIEYLITNGVVLKTPEPKKSKFDMRGFTTEELKDFKSYYNTLHNLHMTDYDCERYRAIVEELEKRDG